MLEISSDKTLEIPTASEPPPVRLKRKKKRKKTDLEGAWCQHQIHQGNLMKIHTIGGVAEEKLLKRGKYFLEITDGPDNVQPIEKLDTLCIARVKTYRWFEHNAFRRDEEVKKLGLLPQPNSRYQAPEEWLARSASEDKPLRWTLLDGTVFDGVAVDWTRYAAMVRIPRTTGGQLLVFWHAVHRVEWPEDTPPAQEEAGVGEA